MDDSALTFFLVFLCLLFLTVVYDVFSGELCCLFLCVCVSVCDGLPLGGVVNGTSSSCVGHKRDESIGGNSQYLFTLTVVYLSSPTFFS